MRGRYLDLNIHALDERAEAAYDIYRKCSVCPHACGIDRTQGKIGYCRQTDSLKVSSCVQHFGEETPLTGTHGVGNIFLTSCNMRCNYCQNYQISQLRDGSEQSYEEVADQMLALQSLGVHYIGWVSPSHVVPGLLKSLVIARRKGFTLPIIYNSNGYDSINTLKLLDGVIDIYLPDMKYADNVIAKKYSHIKDYVEHSREAVLEMFRQVGPTVFDKDGMAQRGVLIRHLVLPGNLAGTWETLCFIALEMSPKITLSLMSQYHPVYKAVHDPVIGRTISTAEYDDAIRMAEELGFEHLLVQRMDSRLHNLPDFRKKTNPFPLKQSCNEEISTQ
jgi:putative pyruvate formate lyase activating enzyme